MNKLTYGIAIGAVVLGTVGYVGISTFAQANAEKEAQSIAGAAPIIVESNEIIVDAVVVPVREADLSLATNGIVQNVFVEEGDYVEAGQSLLQLKSERLQASLAQAEANLANAEANLAELLAPPKSEEVAKYQSSITSAQAALQDVLDGASNADIASREAELANAAADLRLAQSDYDEVKWRSDIAMLNEALELEKATNNYNVAKANLDDLLAEANTSDVASANASIVSAQADLDLLLAGTTQEAIDAAKATVAANQASVRDAQAALSEATLVAPFAGIVAAINTEIGEQVSSGSAVMQVADTTVWRIETEDLTELDVVDVEQGDQVAVSFDALSDVALSGIVKNIKPLGENNQGDITYTVLVDLDEQDKRLRWNMSAEATIAADEAGRAAAREQTDYAISAAQPAAQSNTEVKSVGDLLSSIDTDTTAGPKASAELAKAQVSVNGSVLNVRQGPDTSYTIVDGLDHGATVTILQSNATGTWMEVSFSDGQSDGQSGWVSSEYLTLNDDIINLALSGEANGL